MRWDAAEAEAAVERIWDLHDRLSDAILAASRAHLLLPSPPPPPVPSAPSAKGAYRVGGGGRNGCVFVKGGGGGGGGGGDALGAVAEALAEARSLHAIRSALEDVEDHLEFLHVRLLAPLPTEQPSLHGADDLSDCVQDGYAVKLHIYDLSHGIAWQFSVARPLRQFGNCHPNYYHGVCDENKIVTQ